MEAVPTLLRRIAAQIGPGEAALQVPHPIRVPKSRLMKPRELERSVELAARQCEPGDGILVLLDADDDCPAALGPELLGRARTARADRVIGVVLAKREYESWFLAAAPSIAGHRGLDPELSPPDDPESIRGAKEWLSRSMSGGSYRETIDQAPLTAVFDLDAARKAPSFAKLWRFLREVLVPTGGPPAKGPTS